MENKVVLYFKIETEDDIDMEFLNKKLAIKLEYKIYKKGEIKNPSNKKSNAKWTINSLVLKSETNLDFIEQLNFFLDELNPKKEEIIKLSNNYLIYFSCAIYLHSQSEPSPYINLTKKYSDFIKDTNIEFEIYIYNCLS